jgi:hypothetical protein
MGARVKDVATAPIRDVLVELADTLQWPAWFDTDQGEKYAGQVRARLLEWLADPRCIVL